MIVLPFLASSATRWALSEHWLSPRRIQYRAPAFSSIVSGNGTASDLFSGLAKTPIFGFIISIVGCHFGLSTTGGRRAWDGARRGPLSLYRLRSLWPTSF